MLTEAGLAAHYFVARPTARAAIERLVADSLLERGTHKSAPVKSLGADSLRDIYFVLAIPEPEVVRRRARSGHVPQSAISHNAEISSRRSLPSSAIIDPDMDFHTALIDVMDSERARRNPRPSRDERSPGCGQFA